MLSNKNKNIAILFLTIFIVVLISIIIYFVTLTKQNYEDPLENPINKGIKDFLIENKNNPIMNTENILKMEKPIKLFSNFKKDPETVYPEYVTKSHCPNGVCQFLGHGYNLSKINIFRPGDFPTPKTIFKRESLNLNKNQICLPYYKAGILSQDSVRLDTTEKIVNNMSNSTSGGGGFLKNLISFSASIEAVASSSSTSTTNTQAANLTIENRTGRIDISADSGDNYCTSDNIDESVLKAFMDLSSDIVDPNDLGSWEQYTQFVDSYGTHVVTSVHFGSKIEIWESLLDNNTENSKYLGIQACVAMSAKDPLKSSTSETLEGVIYRKFEDSPDNPAITTEAPSKSVDPIKFDICNTYNQDDYINATKMNIQKHTYFMGGEDKLRNAYSKLTIDTISKEQIMAFLNSSKDSNQAISFYFTPIWDIITRTLISKRNRDISPYNSFPIAKFRQISTNLLTYYVKTLACYPKTDSKGNRMQWLGKSGNATTGNVSYQCNNIGPGCGAFGDNCYQSGGCKGRGGEGSFRISSTPYKFSCPGNPVYPTEFGTAGNMGCAYDWLDAQCRCKNPAQNKPIREIWNSSGCSA